MRKISLVLLTLLALPGCVTSMSDIRDREVQDDIVTERALPAVRECLITELSTGKTPFVNGDDIRTEITFSTEQAGFIFHYTLTAVDGGTRVQARRKNNIANGFNLGRQCYGVDAS